MGQLRHIFYAQPYYLVLLEMATVYIVWTFLMLLLRGKTRRIVAVVGLLLSLTLVACLTIVGRSQGGEIMLIPFITFFRAFINPGYLRSAIMNIALFIPLGLTLPYVLPDRIRRKVPVTVLAGLLLSIAVEAAQLLFALGNSEMDDILMNTFGAFLGATSWSVCVYTWNHYDSWLR